MRHGYFGRKFNRTKNERRRLFAGLVRDLIKHGYIVTTLEKAKAVQPMIEKLITKAKRGGEQQRREIFAVLTDKNDVAMLMDRAKGQFQKRTSGYTQILKMGFRRGDNARAVMFRFVDPAVVQAPIIETKAEAKEEKTKEVKAEKASKVKVEKVEKVEKAKKPAAKK